MNPFRFIILCNAKWLHKGKGVYDGEKMLHDLDACALLHSFFGGCGKHQGHLFGVLPGSKISQTEACSIWNISNLRAPNACFLKGFS